MTVVLIMYILQQCHNCCKKYVIYYVYMEHLKNTWYIIIATFMILITQKNEHIFNIKTINVFSIFILAMPFSYDDQLINILQLYVYRYKRYCNVYVHQLKCFNADFRTPSNVRAISIFSKQSSIYIPYSPPVIPKI